MNDVPADPGRNTRAVILDAFAEELREGGYPGASLDTVAKRAGIRKASLYHHFSGGKEDIFRATALRYIEQQSAYVASAIGQTTVLEDQLVRLATVCVDSPESSAQLGRQVYDATRHTSDEVRTEVSTAYVEGLIVPVVRTMEHAVSEGALVGDPSFLAWSFLGLASAMAPIPDDVAMPTEHRGPRPEVDRTVRSLVALFLDGSRPRSA